MVALCCGSNYVFGSLALPLSKALGGRAVDLLGSCVDIGVYTGILISYLYQGHGVKVTSIVAGLLAGGGYVLLAVLLPYQLPLAVYGLCFFCIGQGSIGLASLSIAVTSKNEAPKNRGKVIGLLQAAYGACALVFSNVFVHVLNSNVISFFWVMAAVLTTMSLVTFVFIDVVPHVPIGVSKPPVRGYGSIGTLLAG
jgi:MFS family permease